jgi:hypothetical protein
MHTTTEPSETLGATSNSQTRSTHVIDASSTVSFALDTIFIILELHTLKIVRNARQRLQTREVGALFKVPP